ncbi:hypothetical protein AX14_004738 [Amanita brunnescens Koide BX004]|nr:hypothetical protein AX14_007577 [Amanita brunnescens Koide BX004]KAF8731539.1 hypothetical protein AX14_004738 [Amanita brunnescens Koide BX004]
MVAWLMQRQSWKEGGEDQETIRTRTKLTLRLVDPKDWNPTGSPALSLRLIEESEHTGKSKLYALQFGIFASFQRSQGRTNSNRYKYLVASHLSNPDPLPPQLRYIVMSSVNNHTGQSERPERSRNAKAQARHRAKRKAYIEQLEQTVTKLQTALGLTPDQVAVLPSPLAKIRELEQENARLQKENEELRRMLAESGGGRGMAMDLSRRNPLAAFQDARACDRDYKRRKMSGHLDGVYLSPSDTPPHDARPPPLTIPQPIPHHYSNVTSANGTPGSAMFNMHPHAFQMPNTPSGSSATSSPPFSVSNFLQRY